MNRNRYNQIQHLTQDIRWESDKNTRKHHIEPSQQMSTKLKGTDKTAWRTRSANNKKDPLKKHRIETVSKKSTCLMVPTSPLFLMQLIKTNRCWFKSIVNLMCFFFIYKSLDWSQICMDIATGQYKDLVRFG